MLLTSNTHPSQIFFTLFFSWSPWKKMMNTDLWTWSPCWKETVLENTSTLVWVHHLICIFFVFSMTLPISCILTVVGSSKGSSISAFLKKTLPRHTLHNILSNVGILSLLITPATNLHRQNRQEFRKDINGHMWQVFTAIYGPRLWTASSYLNLT